MFLESLRCKLGFTGAASLNDTGHSRAHRAVREKTRATLLPKAIFECGSLQVLIYTHEEYPMAYSDPRENTRHPKYGSK